MKLRTLFAESKLYLHPSGKNHLDQKLFLSRLLYSKPYNSAAIKTENRVSDKFFILFVTHTLVSETLFDNKLYFSTSWVSGNTNTLPNSFVAAKESVGRKVYLLSGLQASNGHAQRLWVPLFFFLFPKPTRCSVSELLHRKKGLFLAKSSRV